MEEEEGGGRGGGGSRSPGGGRGDEIVAAAGRGGSLREKNRVRAGAGRPVASEAALASGPGSEGLMNIEI